MPTFSQRSITRLCTCHPDLQRLFQEVVKHVDCSVLQGHRGEDEQNEAFARGASKLKFPDSRHNASPSLAVDVAFYPIQWNNWKRWYMFGGYVKATADRLGIKVRWGGDWDGDGDPSDQKFNDLVHWEIL